MTEGTPQSNHCRATAAVCARPGLHCVLLLRPPPPPGPPRGNHLLDVRLGAAIRGYARAKLDARRDARVAEVPAELRAAGRRPRRTPMGASEPSGCGGYMRAARKPAERFSRAGIEAADIVTAASSVGTYAGLERGRRLYGRPGWRLWGVPVSDTAAHHRAATVQPAAAAARQYEPGVAVEPEELRRIDGYVGEGDTVPHPAAVAALRDLARTEGILLDPVCTAKACWALLDQMRRGYLRTDRPVVFIRTGAVFSDFAWPEVLPAE